MIITRAPLRITLGGGGTDLPSFYEKHGGFCVAAAINKYVYISVHRTFDPGITLKYSKMEHVREIDEVEHPIIRECLKMVGIRDPHIEITSSADIPAGTGLGSSSSFTVALLAALYEFQGIKHRDPGVLAEQACYIEINRLGESIGKQDQYAAAYGCLHAYTFCPDGTVEVDGFAGQHLDDLGLPNDLLMFYTNKRRSASSVMKNQSTEDLPHILATGHRTKYAIDEASSDTLAVELNQQWNLKCKRTPDFDSQIIKWRNDGMKAGAEAGKLIGAGGGGFLMFYCKNAKHHLRAAMFALGLPELRFKFDHHGVEVMVS